MASVLPCCRVAVLVALAQAVRTGGSHQLLRQHDNNCLASIRIATAWTYVTLFST